MLLKMQLKTYLDGTSSGPGVKDLPVIAGDSGSIPGGGNKEPICRGATKLMATTTEPVRASTREPVQSNERYSEDPEC